MPFRIALSSPAGSTRASCPTESARRDVGPLPERCSRTRVRFAAPEPGVPLRVPRRSDGSRAKRRAAPAGSRGRTNVFSALRPSSYLPDSECGLHKNLDTSGPGAPPIYTVPVTVSRTRLRRSVLFTFRQRFRTPTRPRTPSPPRSRVVALIDLDILGSFRSRWPPTRYARLALATTRRTSSERCPFVTAIGRICGAGISALP